MKSPEGLPGGPIGPQALPGYYFDPTVGGYPYGGGPLDLNGARRKNATRETTAALKAWLYEHRKNPYPTKGEKIMLAIITKMTLTQVRPLSIDRQVTKSDYTFGSQSEGYAQGVIHEKGLHAGSFLFKSKEYSFHLNQHNNGISFDRKFTRKGTMLMSLRYSNLDELGP